MTVKKLFIAYSFAKCITFSSIPGRFALENWMNPMKLLQIETKKISWVSDVSPIARHSRLDYCVR